MCGPHDNTNVTHMALGGPSVWHAWSAALHISSVFTKISSWKFAILLRPVLGSTEGHEVVCRKAVSVIFTVHSAAGQRVDPKKPSVVFSHGRTFRQNINIYMCCAYLYIYLSVCLSVYLPTCLSIHPSITRRIVIVIIPNLLIWTEESRVPFPTRTRYFISLNPPDRL